MKIMNILVFILFLFLTAKINERVLIESNSKSKGPKNEIFLDSGFVKSHKNTRGYNEISPKRKEREADL
jgi:hypothetical protein